MQGDSRIQLLDKLQAHLQDVASGGAAKLDVAMLERSQAILSVEIPKQILLNLQAVAITAFRSIREDPRPLSDLIVKAASFVTFTEAQTIITLDNLIEGLQIPLPLASYVALNLLLKAADAPGDAAAVGSKPGFLDAVIKVWLTTEETFVSEKALQVLLSLLSIDLPYKTTYIDKPQEDRVGNASGQGLVWRRIFHDKDVYRLFYTCCTSSAANTLSLSRSQISNAQGRLFDFISAVAPMNWDAIALPRYAEIENDYGAESLLDFVANKMIDQDDLLMKATRFDFCVKLVKLRSVAKEGCSSLPTIPTDSSPALEFLVRHHIHKEIFQYYLKEEEVDSMILSLMSNIHQRYIATYLRTYPDHFLRDHQKAYSVLRTLNKNLDVRPAVWAHGTPPYPDCWILQALPPSLLADSSVRDDNPVNRLPTSPANAAALYTLAALFHGGTARPGLDQSQDHDLMDISSSLSTGAAPTEPSPTSAASRTLLLQYVGAHPEFWSNVGAATNVLAMEEAAVAAVSLIQSIMTARWSDEESRTAVEPTVKTGTAALLLLGNQAFQSLLLAPQPIAGSAGSDSSSAAWKIARAKFDAMLDMQRAMAAGIGKNEVPASVWHTAKANLEESIQFGPWGRVAGAGSRVQTMED